MKYKEKRKSGKDLTMSNKMSIITAGIICVGIATVIIPGFIGASESESRVEAPYNSAIQAERIKAFNRDCPKYFDANIIQKYTSMSKFSWCDDMKKD